MLSYYEIKGSPRLVFVALLAFGVLVLLAHLPLFVGHGGGGVRRGLE